MAKTVLPASVLEEYRRLIRAVGGRKDRRSRARHVVYAMMVARYGHAWWQENRETILGELDAEDAKARDG